MNSQATQNQSRFVKYETSGFSIYVLENWEVQKIDRHRTVFYGPKVGNVSVGFYVNLLERNEKLFLDIYKEAYTKQEGEKEYQLHDEENFLKEDLRSIMRHSSWYNSTIDKRLFIREIFTEFGNSIFVLSSSIPDNPKIIEFDTAITHMMNSFTIIK